MGQYEKTFSESWYRIADLKLALRPTVQVSRQLFRGEEWYLLQDPFNNQFFRIRPEAYAFVGRMGRHKTVEDVWNECNELNPDSSPGQEEVLQLLTQLYYTNLLYYDVTPDCDKLFDRYHKRRKKEIQSKLMSIMFIRVPLLDPDLFLDRLKPLIKIVLNPLFAIIWGLVVFFAANSVIENFDQIMEQSQGVLAPGNLFMLYVGLVIIKTLHEFGHAAMCKRFGGEVHTMGVMFILFSPIPFMDATASWSFREPWKRAVVAASGMIVEVFLASLAVFVWAKTGQGVVHSLAYNIIFIASVSTVIFNINPLMRLDGYYILSDLLDIPNLSGRAMMQLRHVAERYLFGCKDSQSSANSTGEAIFLVFFGVLSGIYRVIVFGGIILFVADKFLVAGLVMALICVVSWGLVPLFRFVLYLVSSSKLERTRFRACAVILSFLFVLTLCLVIIPFPNRFRAPGVIEAKEYAKVTTAVSGYVDEVLVSSGVFVEKGTPLIRMSNHEIDLDIQRIQAELREAIAMRKQAMTEAAVDVAPLEKRLDSLQKALHHVEEQKLGLLLNARKSGIWVSPDASDTVGSWLPRGAQIGEIVNPASFRFSAVISQDEASNLFVDKIRDVEVRLFGQAAHNIDIAAYQIIPYENQRLPSAALGWLGGGDVGVSLTDESGLQTSEPFFRINADIIKDGGVAYLHGRSGKIRFSMDAEPLFVQWGRKIRQLLQKRYQL